MDTPPFDYQEFVQLIYRGVLRRPAPPEAIGALAEQLESGKTTPNALLAAVIEGPEFRGTSLRANYDPDADPQLQQHLNPAVAELTSRLGSCEAISRETYDRCWVEVFEESDDINDGQRSYGDLHRKRFFELINAVALLTEGNSSPRVLEFGVSEFSVMYRKIFPELRLDTADRPLTPGQREYLDKMRNRAGATGHYTVDLNEPDWVTDEIRSQAGQFHLVLCTEVLEHLTAHPCDVLAPMIELLAPGGSLYLTTPNFFARGRLNQINQRNNPQQVFPRGFTNTDAPHHHHREYVMGELLDFIVESGGAVSSFYFSGCWESDDLLQELVGAATGDLSNLVATIQRPG